jgi:hypothetical protein
MKVTERATGKTLTVLHVYGVCWMDETKVYHEDSLNFCQY